LPSRRFPFARPDRSSPALSCEFLPETVPHGRKHKIPSPPKLRVPRFFCWRPVPSPAQAKSQGWQWCRPNKQKETEHDDEQKTRF
jgi:hypothetical protein